MQPRDVLSSRVLGQDAHGGNRASMKPECVHRSLWGEGMWFLAGEQRLGDRQGEQVRAGVGEGP